MRTRIIAAAALAAITAGCAHGAAGGAGDAPADSVTAVLHDATGQEGARATATQVVDGVRIDLTASAVAPGTHGLHIHAIGRCEAPDYATAGPHWNPTKRQHGKDNPQGMHMGDLPNLTVGDDGHGTVSFTIPGASLRSGATPLLDADGAAIVIHSGPDDYVTDPSGSSGGRKLCGVFG
ncbi:MAG: superoxide dismutase family protein [Sphingomonadales bacterium]